MSNTLVLLGVGNVALHTARLLNNSCTIYGTTRSPERKALIASAGITPIVIDSESTPTHLLSNAWVLVSFPPDGHSDATWASRCIDAKKIIYISSTGVYGKRSGVIDETTQVDVSELSAQRRVEAENIWRELGGLILRCPGLYGPESGMHLRIKQIKIPGDGQNYVSRIHLDDLAAIIAACFAQHLKEQTYVVGDLNPSTHLEAISYVCKQMGAPLPEHAHLQDVSPTLRGNRQIDASKLLGELQLTLKYPSYREGYDQILRK